MTISRRALGLGLLGLSVVGTGGYLALKDNPALVSLFGEPTSLWGFVGGEKKGFLTNPEVMRALRSAGAIVEGRTAGSVEMVRQQALLNQSPNFLWPSSSVMVEIAKSGGVKVRRDQVILNSPLVIYSWSEIADGLASRGLVTKGPSGQLNLDLAAVLKAIVAGDDWKTVGVPELFGKARIIATDPNRSNSGFMFAGLIANLLAGDIATPQTLARDGASIEELFRKMGYKTHSSGSLFEDYLAGGPGAQPMIVGYENQLVEWILSDPARWQRIQAGKTKPVALYPTPTVYSAHPLMSLTPDADKLIEILTSPELQTLAWRDHGFRGPLGAVGSDTAVAVQGLLPERIDAITPMPEADVMMSILNRLAV